MVNKPTEQLRLLSEDSQEYTPDTLNALFQKHRQAYQQARSEERLHQHFWHRISLGLFTFWLLCLLLTILFLSPLMALASMVVFFVMGFTAGKVIGEPNKHHHERERNLAKARLLQSLFALLRADLHPSSQIKGQWILQAEDESIAESDIYRRKTSPHSRSQKFYAKKYWAVFRLTLIDGSQLKIKCWDKVKKKGGYLRNQRQAGGTVVQFEMQGKTALKTNPLLYHASPQAHQHTLWGKGGVSFYETPEAYAHRLLIQLKQQCRQSMKPLTQPVSATTDQESSVHESPELQRWSALLSDSEIPLQHHIQNAQSLAIDYTASSASATQRVELYLPGSPGPEALLRIPITAVDTQERERLLANPCLRAGRFALMENQLYLLRPLTEQSLASLEQRLVALCQLAQALEKTSLPTKMPSAAVPDLTALRQHLQSELPRLKLLTAPQYQENKCKLHLQLSTGRKQTVHLRFDRQDRDQKPLLYILSYCAIEKPEDYHLAFQRNAEPFESGLGLASLGTASYLAVYLAVPLSNAHQAPLAQYIQEVAQRADALELHLTAKDQQ